MDFRVIVVLAPLAVAAGWAIFNIGSAALAQLQRYTGQDSQLQNTIKSSLIFTITIDYYLFKVVVFLYKKCIILFK